MTRGPRKAVVLLTFAVALSAAAGRDAAAQAVPYPLKDCEALAKDLQKRVPISSSFSTGIHWFREGDLGIKGRQCRIAAEGPVSEKVNHKAAPGLEDMVRAVSQVLEKHGFKKNTMVDRFSRKGKAYRAFAMRKDRITCWTNVEFQDPPAKEGASRKPAAKPAPNWTLSVECFKG